MNMKVKEGFILRAMGENHLVVPVGALTVDFRCIITLNDTGAFLWQQLQQECSEAELVQQLLDEYDVTAERATADVTAFVEQLKKADLLV